VLIVLFVVLLAGGRVPGVGFPPVAAAVLIYVVAAAVVVVHEDTVVA